MAAQYLKISKIIEIFLYFKFILNLTNWKLGLSSLKNMLYNIVIKHITPSSQLELSDFFKDVSEKRDHPKT